MDILKELKENGEKEYAQFQSKLTPTINSNLFIGVRVPKLRELAKKYKGTLEGKSFLKKLPHHYYDENVLHGLLIGEIKDYPGCILEVNRFLPYVDNWAVCDIMSPKVFKKNKEELLKEIIKWSQSERTFECRFGVGMLMKYYLDDDFKKEYLDIPLQVKLDDYYVQMMIAWFYATALAKQWKDTILYLEHRLLKDAIHNKTIQKAVESFRISGEKKEYLKSLKVSLQCK